jgi:hypothetical protein
MDLASRERAIVNLVSRFSQLTSFQIRSLVFPNIYSHTPANRCLRRLVDAKYLIRIDRRLVGGTRGGSGQYCYGLGVEGHKLHREGRYIPARAIRYHSLAIADCYVALVELERAGRLRILGYSNEPDCHRTIGRYELKPDLYAELSRPNGGSIRLMFEIDMGSQGQRQITDKFARYWGAYKAAEPSEWPDDQYVLFVAVDDERQRELRWLLEKGNREQQALFRLTTSAQLSTALG